MLQVCLFYKQTVGYHGNDEELAQLENVGGHLVQLTPEMIKELSSDQIYKIYQMYVKVGQRHLGGLCAWWRSISSAMSHVVTACSVLLHRS